MDLGFLTLAGFWGDAGSKKLLEDIEENIATLQVHVAGGERRALVTHHSCDLNLHLVNVLLSCAAAIGMVVSNLPKLLNSRKENIPLLEIVLYSSPVNLGATSLASNNAPEAIQLVEKLL
jgi:hypothetical protein